MIKFTASLMPTVFRGYEAEAHRQCKPVIDLIRETLTDIAIRNNWLDGDLPFDIQVYRDLTNEVAEAAHQITVDSGWHEDITLLAIKVCQNRPNWLQRYSDLIGDKNVHVAGNAIKTSLNQNFGQYVKVKLNAKNKLDGDGKRVTVQVAGELVRSYTLLVKGE